MCGTDPLKINFAILQGAIVAALLLIAAVVVGARVVAIVQADPQAAVVVSCESKFVRRGGGVRRRGRQTKAWAYAPLAVSESGHKAVGTRFVRKTWCNSLVGRKTTILTNAEPSNNRINSFFQFWLIPTALIFAIGFVATLRKPAVSAAIFFGFFAVSGGAIALEFGVLSGMDGDQRVSETKRASLALEACIGEAIAREGVAHESELKSLQCADHGLTDISRLSRLTKLQVLVLRSNDLTGLEALRPLTRLRKLSVHHNEKIKSLAGLENMRMLEELNAYQLQLTDITALRNLRSLRRVDLSGNQLTDITALGGLDQLETVNLNSNPFSDLRPLMDKPQLKNLFFLSSRVEDITPLLNTTSLKSVGAVTQGPVDCSQIRELRSRLGRAARVTAQKSCG